MRRHQPRGDLCGRGVATMFVRQHNISVGDAMLVVDGDHRQPLAPAYMAGHWLEIGDDQINLPFIGQVHQSGKASRRFGSGDQVFSQRAPVAYRIVYVGKAEAENFRHRKIFAQVSKPSIKRDNANRVSLAIRCEMTSLARVEWPEPSPLTP